MRKIQIYQIWKYGSLDNCKEKIDIVTDRISHMICGIPNIFYLETIVKIWFSYIDKQINLFNHMMVLDSYHR